MTLVDKIHEDIKKLITKIDEITSPELKMAKAKLEEAKTWIKAHLDNESD